MYSSSSLPGQVPFSYENSQDLPVFGTNDFANNPEPRCPVILLLDTSGSIRGTPIRELNAGVELFRDELLVDNLASKRVEVAIVGFGPVLTQKLVEWRKTLEVRFQHYRPTPSDLASLNSIDHKYERKRSELESKLVGGKAQLEYDCDTLIEKRKQVHKQAEGIAKKLAQAQADMKVYT